MRRAESDVLTLYVLHVLYFATLGEFLSAHLRSEITDV
jgi:hypothetical protein